MCEGEFGITRREWRFIALLAKRLIERRSQRGDRRRATVALSAEGKALHARIFPRVVEIANSGLFEAVADQRGGGS